MTNRIRFKDWVNKALTCFVGFVCVSHVGAAGNDALDFDIEIMPVLSRMGCNAGACHGAAVGRGGFRLSLFGADPAGDFENIVHELEGRRINLARPNDSLLLLKPTKQIEHGGGYRFGADDPAGERLRRWIAEGARRSNTPTRLVEYVVSPANHFANKPDEPVPLRATARFSDGRSTDVADWTIWQTNDPAAVVIADGQATIRRPGQHVVIARYLDRIVPMRLTLPFDNGIVNSANGRTNNFIDEHVNQTLQSLRLPAASPSEDTAFLRRIRLDLTGRLPDLKEINAFGQDNSRDKRAQLIDRLLASDDFVEYWTFQLATLLKNRPLPGESAGAIALHRWLSDQLRLKRGMNELMRDILVARGDSHRHGPAWYWRLSNDARAQAESIGQAFLGVRLQCANCHNHPLDRWTQDDYHGLAAMLAKLERGRNISVSMRGEVTHPRTGEPARPMFPGVARSDKSPDMREPLATWLMAIDNPYFAKAIVNRLWKSMFGRGLVEPVDDLRDTNPATHPALLDQLAADFVTNGYDLRHTLRLMANSATYGRSADTTPANRNDDRYYSHAFDRPLGAEVLADAWADVTGVWDKYGDLPVGTRAIALFDPATPSRTLDLLGRCSRKESCDGGTTAEGLPALLQRINGAAVNRKLTDAEGRLHRLIVEGKSNDDIIGEFFQRAAGRLPTEEEKKLLVQPVATKRSAWLEDVVWALLNSREFTTNH